MKSKRNETFGSLIFGTNMIQRTWSARQEAIEEATRVEGAPFPGGRAPCLVVPSRHPPMYLFLLYIPTYPVNIRGDHEKLFPPP